MYRAAGGAPAPPETPPPPAPPHRAASNRRLPRTPRRAVQSLDIFLHGDGPLQAVAASSAAEDGGRWTAGPAEEPAAAAAPVRQQRGRLSTPLSRWTAVDDDSDAKEEAATALPAAEADGGAAAPVSGLGGDWPVRAAGSAEGDDGGGAERVDVPAAAMSAAVAGLSEAERTRLRAVELALVKFRDGLEEAGGLSRAEVEARVATQRQKLLAAEEEEQGDTGRGREADRDRRGGADKRKRSRSRSRERGQQRGPSGGSSRR